MSTLDSFLSKRRQQSQTANNKNAINASTAFITPQEYIKPSITNKPKSTTNKNNKKSLNNKKPVHRNTITRYFNKQKEEEEKVILYSVRKPKPLMDAWNDVIKEYEEEEEEEEKIFYTVRQPKSLMSIWNTILSELAIEELRENKRKSEGVEGGIKRQRTSYDEILCHYMNEQLHI